MTVSLCKNSRYYEHCIKQTPARQFSTLINDSDLRKINLHKQLLQTKRLQSVGLHVNITDGLFS